MNIQYVGQADLKDHDVEVSKEFYVGALGMKISSESPSATFFHFNYYRHDIGVFKVRENVQSVQASLLGIALAGWAGEVTNNGAVKRVTVGSREHREYMIRALEVSGSSLVISSGFLLDKTVDDSGIRCRISTSEKCTLNSDYHPDASVEESYH